MEGMRHIAYYLCLRGSIGVSKVACSALPAVEMDADLIWPLADRTGRPSPAPRVLHNKQLPTLHRQTNLAIQLGAPFKPEPYNTVTILA